LPQKAPHWTPMWHKCDTSLRADRHVWFLILRRL